MNINTIETTDLSTVAESELIEFLNAGDNKRNVRVLGLICGELIRRHAEACEDMEECEFNPLVVMR